MMADYVRATQRYTIQPGSFAYYALGSGAVSNLSLGGLFIEDPGHSFESGQEISLELRLDQESFTIHGVVRHSRPGVGFGVLFTDFPEDSKQRLVAYFRKHFGRSD